MTDAEFEFQVLDAFRLGSDFLGDVTLVGPETTSSGDLRIGDILEVTTHRDRTRMVRCVQFPLIRLAPERAHWVRVGVTGIRLAEVRIGGWAIRQGGPR